MSLPAIFLRRHAFAAAVIVLSGVAWLFSWQVAEWLFGFTIIRAGITLVYVPAGVRLVILLVAGLWGALGIALAFPLALLQVFPDVTWQEALTYSLLAGFVPYATVLVVCRAARVSHDLRTLRSIHLPLLSAAVSVSGALSFTAALAAFGRFSPSRFLADATAMTAGDFLGCFAVVMLVRFAVSSVRSKR